MKDFSSLLHPIKLDEGVEIQGNLLLAPMAGFTDAALRHVATMYGADFCFTEMVSCEALVRENEKTLHLLKKADNESNYGIQLFTPSPERASASVKKLLPFRPLLIDLNCGCPVPKITKNSAGSALMREPEKIGAIVAAIVQALATEGYNIPVTVKMRTGWDFSSINFMKVAECAVKSGAKMITIHGRTKTQGYSGKADWEAIKTAKENLGVPVIGSGDLFTPESCIQMLEETGCDGIMVARGAVGRPWIFQEIKELLTEDKTFENITVKEKISIAKLHLELAIKYIGEKIAVNEMKKHLCAYIKGIAGAAVYRNILVRCQSAQEYMELFKQIEAEL